MHERALPSPAGADSPCNSRGSVNRPRPACPNRIMASRRFNILTAPLKVALALCPVRSEEHTSELQSLRHLVCRLLLEKKKNNAFLDSNALLCMPTKGLRAFLQL